MNRRSSIWQQNAVGLSFVALLLVGFGGCQQASQDQVTIQPEKTVVVQPQADTAPASAAEPQTPPATQTPAETATPVAEGSSSGELVLAGKYRVTAPEGWERRKPAVSMIEHEFSIPPVEGETRAGRATFMAAGGSVEANIERWINQFTQPDGVSSAERTKRETLEIAGTKVHLVDISGTYLESSGPMMGNAVPRENYRMLGAVIESPNDLSYFIKFYGPEKTIAAHADGFRKMLESLRQNQ